MEVEEHVLYLEPSESKVFTPREHIQHFKCPSRGGEFLELAPNVCIGFHSLGLRIAFYSIHQLTGEINSDVGIHVCYRDNIKIFFPTLSHLEVVHSSGEEKLRELVEGVYYTYSNLSGSTKNLDLNGFLERWGKVGG